MSLNFCFVQYSSYPMRSALSSFSSFKIRKPSRGIKSATPCDFLENPVASCLPVLDQDSQIVRLCQTGQQDEPMVRSQAPSEILETLYFLNILPGKAVLFVTSMVAAVALLPVQIVAWMISGRRFSQTMPLAFLVALGLGFDADVTPPMPPLLHPLIAEIRVMYSFRMDHVKFVRVFFFLRRYKQHESGVVDVFPGLAPRHKGLRFSAGLVFTVLCNAPPAALVWAIAQA